MKQALLRCAAAMTLLAALAAAGCSDATGPVAVSGVVKLDGRPLAGATVMFHPRATGARPAIGVTDQHGGFHLTTFKPRDGALRGDYQVTIQSGTEAPVKKIDRQILEKGLQGDMPPAPPSRVHENYTKVDTTPLKQVVPPSGPIEFSLTSDGK